MLEQNASFEGRTEWEDDAEKGLENRHWWCHYLAVKMLSQHQDSQFCEKSCVTAMVGREEGGGSQLTGPEGDMKAFVVAKNLLT